MGNLLLQANQHLINGNHDKAIELYQRLFLANPEFKSYAFNLDLALRRVAAEKRQAVLKELFSRQHAISLNAAMELMQFTALFDEPFYKSQVDLGLPADVPAALHYLALGWALGYEPSAQFASKQATNQTHRKALRPRSPLIDYLLPKHHKEKEESNRKDIDLSAQLWGGHSATALIELHSIATNTELDAHTRWWAMWHVARWYYFTGDYQKALALGNAMEQLGAVNSLRKERWYLQYFCLVLTQQKAAAYKLLRRYLDLFPQDADTMLALANSASDDAARLQLINQAFTLHGLTGLQLKTAEKSLGLATIQGQPTPAVNGDQKVSIILPIYNAQHQIETAIESLLAQSYVNLEIIAVDDCSTDETYAVLKKLEQKDHRVKALQVSVNGGAYAARNYGLHRATGDFITTHDSDDWSHPQKIALQVAYLTQHPTVMGCVTHWARVTADLGFTQNWRPENRITHWSHSSFMFRKEVKETLGEWDHVRIGGDTEYIWRMQAHYGKDSFAKIHPEIPLAFALDEESSLTRTKATHVRTVYFGLRHIYRQIAEWWHSQSAVLSLPAADTQRAFNAPIPMWRKQTDPEHYDLCVAGDYSNLADVLAAAKLIQTHPNKKVALFHWPAFGHAERKLCALYFELVGRPNVEPIVSGQPVEAVDYYLTNNSLVHYPLDAYPLWNKSESWQLLENRPNSV